MGGASLTAGRAAYHRRAWSDAYRSLSACDAAEPLDPADRALMATAAHLSGRNEAAAQAWERAYHDFIASGAVGSAARCAFWLGLTLMLRGEHAHGSGWIGRARTVLDDEGGDCPERGYLLIPSALGALEGGQPDAAYDTFLVIAATADRFDDPDLAALALLGRGQAMIARGDARGGMEILDAAMLAATGGEVSPIPTGLIYCAVILACKDIFDVQRAREWTEALSRWCDSQQDLYPYRGQCLVHRSELLGLQGRWADAMVEVDRACAQLSAPPGDPVLGMALYQRAEIQRVRGDYAAAEASYRAAADCGHPMHPGMALLRLAQDRPGDAAAAIRRTLAESDRPGQRSRCLAAYVEIMLAVGAVEDADRAAAELGRLAVDFGSPLLEATAGYARGCVLLARGDAVGAGAPLQRSRRVWQELDAPFEAARTQVRIAEAARRLGDHDTADVHLGAARRIFDQLGALPARELVDSLARTAAVPAPGGLTPREVDVLRLVATGATNRQIAETLVISDKTVARHLANIFTKLGLSTRAAATAYAYEHAIV